MTISRDIKTINLVELGVKLFFRKRVVDRDHFDTSLLKELYVSSGYV